MPGRCSGAEAGVWPGDGRPGAEGCWRLVESGLLASDGKTVRLTAQGQLLSNDVFQEFIAPQTKPATRMDRGRVYCMISLNLENYLEVSVIHRLRQPTEE